MARTYPGFYSMKELRNYFPLDASPPQGYPQQYVAITHLHTWMERDNVG